jgi:D-glycero-D-manno-heptose 1,7-bisphosphate phosphatase
VNSVGLFLDRDGTINTEVDFLTRPEDLQLIPNAAEAIREANRLGIIVVVITNQSGIARGLMSEDDVQAVHQRLEELLAARGARVDAIYYCPHHPDYGTPQYRKACTCRKPKTGMLERAAQEFGFDLRSSFVVGDRWVDMKAGELAGCGTVLVLTGYGATEREECEKTARVDHIAADLYAAWLYIKHRLQKQQQTSERAT